MWLAFGLLLLVLELITPSGFYLMFFGLGALSVGVLTWLDLTGPAWTEWLAFTAISLVFVVAFRGRLRGAVEEPRIGGEIDPLVGELALPRERIEPGTVGRVELRGTLWNARNDTPATLEAGQRCRVAGVDGLIVSIQPE